MSNVKDLLNRLKLRAKEESTACYVPSLNQVISAAELSVKQQKDIIKSSLEEHLAGLSFAIAINNIILDNVQDAKQLLVYDKPSIILAIRNKALGSKAKTQDGDDVDFASKLNLRIDISKYPTTEEFSYEGINVVVSIPTLDRDQKINLAAYNVAKSEKISGTIGVMYLYEIAKFIQSVSFDGVTIDCHKITPGEVVAIIENLPTILNDQIVDYMTRTVREIENLYFTVDDKKIQFDPTFFSK